MYHIDLKKILLLLFIILLIAIIIIIVTYCFSNQEEHTLWPKNVIIVSPSDDVNKTQQLLDNIYTKMGGIIPHAWNGQFSNNRFAIMFMPGTYNLNIKIGYYTSIIGLGQTPEDVIIYGNVSVPDGSPDKTQGGLSNFWRSCENITINTSGSKSIELSISQASPLRKLNIIGDLFLFTIPLGGGDASFTSGGFLADSKISGTIYNGSQQQFFTRNTSFKSWGGSVWNQVFSGCINAPATTCQQNKNSIVYDNTPTYTNTGTVETIAEKPYIIYDKKSYYLFIPNLEKNKVGPTTNFNNGKLVPFSSVYIAWSTDSTQIINQQIENGKHIILSPGIYNLDDSIVVNRSNTVILGIGMPTLISSGKPCISVGNTEGVRISGLIVQASDKHSETLFQWGVKNGPAGNQENPGMIQDVFGRVGGPDTTPVSTGSMVTINQSHVIIDNSWLWVADHGKKVGYGINSCDYGLIANGDNITAYGLMCEHNDKDNVLWNGENGEVYFYQSEFRYDFPNMSAIDQSGGKQNVSYRVSENVNNHTAYGLGAYTFSPLNKIMFDNGFKVPKKPNVKMTNICTIFLGGIEGSGIKNVINDTGGSVKNKTKNKSYVCNFSGN